MTSENQPKTPLELEFELIRLQRFLQENPSQAIEQALNLYEDFLNLSREINTLEQICQSLLADNQRLTSQLIEQSSPKTVTLPSFLHCHRH